jgi:ubiquinone biosynthesis protein COQ4
MTDAALQSNFVGETPVIDTPRAPTYLPRQKVQPLRAFRAFRRLLANKEDTQQVFEIMQALNGKSTAKAYRRLLRTVEGGRLAYRRVEMNELLNDQAYLDRLPDGSVGAAYRDFMRSENLSAEGLAEESRKAAQRRGVLVEIEHPMAWFGRRIRDTHDIWHTLTGYGRDGLGELCLVAFSYAQTRSLGWAFIAVGGCLRALQEKGGHRAVKAVWQAYKNGKAAAWLPGEDFERILVEPVAVARRRLNIAAPTAYLAIPAERRDGAANMG